MRLNILGISLLALLFGACSDFSSGVSVKVRLEGDGMNVPVKLEFPDTVYTASLNGRGEGEFALRGNEGYGVLDYNNCIIPVYINNDDFTISLLVDGNSIRPAFSGKGAKLNFYMSNAKRKTPAYDLEEAQYLAQLKENLAKAESGLEKMGFSEEFAALERVRLRYDYLGTLPGYPVYHSMMTGDDDTLSDAYYNELYSLLDGNAEWLKLREYPLALMTAVNRIALKGIDRVDTSAFVVSQLQIIDKNIKDRAVASKVAASLIVRYMNDRGIDDIQDYQSLLTSLVVCEDDIKAVNEEKSSWEKIAKGAVAPDFAGLTPVSGNEFTWERYKGKYVYILCWLAGSETSFQEAKTMQTLIKKYAKQPVEFITIAGDGSAQHWRKIVESRKYLGENSVALDNRVFLDAMNVQLYPRAILVGPDGKIVKAIAPLPSNPKIVELLDSQLGL